MPWLLFLAARFYLKLSPFYPHGGIPVPFSEGYTATCVEAIWQGLKVFEGCDVDVQMFQNDTMKNIKRTVRRFGKVLLDYDTNADVEDAKKPLSHASLVKAYSDGILKACGREC